MDFLCRGAWCKLSLQPMRVQYPTIFSCSTGNHKSMAWCKGGISRWMCSLKTASVFISLENEASPNLLKADHTKTDNMSTLKTVKANGNCKNNEIIQLIIKPKKLKFSLKASHGIKAYKCQLPA